jgi:hypothetical protein
MQNVHRPAKRVFSVSTKYNPDFLREKHGNNARYSIQLIRITSVYPELHKERLGMKKTLVYLLTAVFAIGLVSTSTASVKKRKPDKRVVANELKKIGGEHYPEEMEVDALDKVETDSEDSATAYFWLFVGELPDDAGYHLIIYDNEQRYLGFYKLKNKPVECGKGYFSVDISNEDTDPVIDSFTGRDDMRSVRLTEKGPTKRLTLSAPDDTPSEFVEAPSMEEVEQKIKEERAASADQASGSTSTSSAKKVTPEYRSWKVKYGENWIEVESAIFVEYKNRQVTLKNGKDGNTATIPLANFSDADKAYLQKLIR